MTKAAIYGCAAAQLSREEHAFYRSSDPWGFILFARNIGTPDEVKRLVGDLRDSVGRNAPILIDQEGGRVARLKPPSWRGWAPARALADANGLDETERCDALRLRYQIIGSELRALGIDVNCAPLLDLPQPGAHDVIGDRALGERVEAVVSRGRAVMDGLLSAGVLPVIKHLPGHGRAMADTHEALAVVETPLEELTATDFAPFAALSDAPLAMTAHVVYSALDPARCATLSPIVLAHCREILGLKGLLMSDDLSMKALDGDFKSRTEGALAAGCDVVLHCNGDMDEMKAVAESLTPLTGEAAARADHALALRTISADLDIAALEADYAALATKAGIVDA